MGLFGENTGSTIAAAGTILGAGIGAASQGGMNKKQRQWNEKMYALQRENALADWNMQNAYNSPEQQMARLKAAGLNPNLVYGNGATATAAAMPRNTDVKSWQPRAPQFDVGSVMGSYMDTAIKKQTLTNMDAQEKVLRQEALSKAADIINKGIAQNRGKLAYDIELATRENIISKSGYQTDLSKQLADNAIWNREFTKISYERVEKQLELMAEQIAVTRTQKEAIVQGIKNAKKDGLIKDFEINLNKLNLTKSDPSYQRMLKGLFDEILKIYNNR